MLCIKSKNRSMLINGIYKILFTYNCIYFAISPRDCIMQSLKKIKKMSDKNRVFIFDTTMRDGEQSPGASMSLEEKIQIARVFDDLVLTSSRLAFRLLHLETLRQLSEVSKILKNSIPAGLARHSKKILIDVMKH